MHSILWRKKTWSKLTNTLLQMANVCQHFSLRAKNYDGTCDSMSLKHIANHIQRWIVELWTSDAWNMLGKNQLWHKANVGISQQQQQTEDRILNGKCTCIPIFTEEIFSWAINIKAFSFQFPLALEKWNAQTVNFIWKQKMK